jgi:two-component system, LuxR family, response regulator FixJ
LSATTPLEREFHFQYQSPKVSVMADEPTVFVIDDDPAMWDSMRLLLGSVRIPVQTFATAGQFLRDYSAEQLGCLILDARLPDIDGLELQQLLIRQSLPIPIIMVSGHGDISMAVRAMKAGAFDFFDKPYNAQTLLERVREALQRAREIRRVEAEIQSVRARRALLTPRENQVLDRIAAGDSTKEMARALDLSAKTIEGHRTRVMEKMEAQTVATLVRMCYLTRARTLPRDSGLLVPCP